MRCRGVKGTASAPVASCETGIGADGQAVVGPLDDHVRVGCDGLQALQDAAWPFKDDGTPGLLNSKVG